MIKAILACDAELGIGKNGTLPWPTNKEDLKQFKEKTTGHIVVMGSKTWDDPFFPGPLKDRINIVITSKNEGYDGATKINGDVVTHVQQLSRNTDKDVWIIGGASIYKQFEDIIEEWHVTNVDGVYECDTFIAFPPNLHHVQYTVTPENAYSILKKEI